MLISSYRGGRRLLSIVLVSVGACAGSDASAPPNSVGPESLTVFLRSGPDTIAATGLLEVGAAAYNRSAHVVFARYEAPKCGLIIEVTGPGISLTAPPVCRPNLVNGTTSLIGIGDSVMLGGAIGPPVPAGPYRVRAWFEAANGRSEFTERTVIAK